MADLVAKGIEVLQQLREEGTTSVFNSLKVEDLKALLQHSDPQGPIPKGSKADLKKRVEQLPIVKAAIREFNSRNPRPAPAATPAAPRQPLPPSPPLPPSLPPPRPLPPQLPAPAVPYDPVGGNRTPETVSGVASSGPAADLSVAPDAMVTD